MLAEGRNIDNARRRCRLNPRQQEMSEQEPGEIVDRKAQLVAVLAHAPPWPAVHRSDAGIADENVDPLVLGCNGVRQLPCARVRGQVDLIEDWLRVAAAFDLV